MARRKGINSDRAFDGHLSLRLFGEKLKALSDVVSELDGIELDGRTIKCNRASDSTVRALGLLVGEKWEVNFGTSEIQEVVEETTEVVGTNLDDSGEDGTEEESSTTGDSQSG